MGVAASALTGYRLEASSLEGALNFTVKNSLASFLMLGGIALVYGRTGALNFAQIGHSLATRPDDALAATGVVLVTSALLIKGAIVPFHFWLPDTHVVAASPVCAIFSGIMVPIAIFVAARLYWTVFADLSSARFLMGHTLFAIGAATVLVGGATALMQRHLKRLLAFSTMSHVGIMLVGISLLNPNALAGMLLYLAGHGIVKGGLFLGAGILRSARQGIDEIELRGKGKDMPITGALFALGGLLLAGMPVGLMGSGPRMIAEAAETAGHPWMPWVMALGSALTGAAVLRVAKGCDRHRVGGFRSRARTYVARAGALCRLCARAARIRAGSAAWRPHRRPRCLDDGGARAARRLAGTPLSRTRRSAATKAQLGSVSRAR
jgi:multicomponent Na+:H+ antiporter subunit D